MRLTTFIAWILFVLLSPALYATWSPCTALTGGDYEVHITLVGINMLVHPNDPDNATGPEPITVLFPNVTSGQSNIGTEPHNIPSHFPFILAPKSMLQPKLNKGITFIPAHNEPATYHYYFLNGEQIMIDDMATPVEYNPPVCYTWKTSGTECPTSADDAKALGWFPSVKSLKGSTQVKDAAHFAPIPSADTIAARIQILKGNVESCFTALLKWEFHERDGDGIVVKAQALPQQVRWTLRGVGDHFTLYLAAFDGSYTRQLVFTPVNNKIDIVIGNAPESETGPIAVPHPANSDPHFSIYYEFIDQNTTGTGPIPFHPAMSTCTDTNPSFLCPAALPIAPPPPAAPITAATTSAATRRAKSKSGAAHDAHSASVAIVPGGNPVPSGLNCSSSQWP